MAGAGAAVYFAVVPSLVGAAIVGWYVVESAWGCLVTMQQRSRRREIVWSYLVPRMVSTSAALGISYLLFSSSEQMIALSYMLVLVLENAYRLVLRHTHPAVLQRAQQAFDESAKAVSTKQSGIWRGWGALTCAALLVVALPPTLYAFSLRQAASDVRFYTDRLEHWGLYDALLAWVGEEATGLVRGQDVLIRDAVSQLDGESKRAALQTLLPQPWTRAVIEQSLEALLEWLQTNDERRVPAISVSISDILRHAKEALSFSLDRYVASMPVCPPGTSALASCRPTEISAAAYTASRKPEAMARMDKAFELIPAEVDLSTAVSLSPRTFQGPLKALNKVRAGIETFDRALGWMAVGCLAVVVCLWLSSATSIRSALCWTGATLFVAGIRAWILGWVATSFPQAVLAQLDVRPGSLSARLLPDILSDLTRSACSLLAPLSLALALIGLFVAVTGTLPGPTESKQGLPRSVRALIITLAVSSLSWHAYLTIGRSLYERSYAHHRQGQVSQAAAGYRHIVRFYPIAVDEWVNRARQKLRECERYQKAEAAFQAGDWPSAVQEYEALLVSQPVMALQDTAQERLRQALYAHAQSLQQAGEYERALGHYHWIQEELRDKQVGQNLVNLYWAWGESFQKAGDYPAAIATFHRLTYDIANARIWAEVDERVKEAYCDWSQKLRTKGEHEQANKVCQEFLQTFSPQEMGDCPECADQAPGQ